MPHKQKEGHDHSTFSKKQALEKKRAKDAAKKAKEEAKLVEEEAKKLLLGNNVPLVDGHGEYELGYEPDEKEQRFNKLKRCKKHLRNDLRIKQLKEEEERRVAEEERQRTERLALEAETARKRKEERRAAGEEVTDSEEDETSSEDEEEFRELVVYFCECCDRKYATRNAFINHMNSKRHRVCAAPYEEAGLLVYSLEVKTTENEGECSDSDESDNDSDSDAEDDDDVNNVAKPTVIGFSALALGSRSDDDSNDDDDEGSNNTNENVSEAGDEQKPSIFAALRDSENSGSESSDDEQQKESEDFIANQASPPAHIMTEEELAAQLAAEDEAEDMYLEELILQNKLRSIPDPDFSPSVATPLPFTNEFDAELYPGINEARFARIRHKLQSKLAEKGIEPKVSELTEMCNGLDPVALGRTLLQQVMAARMDNLQARLNAYNTYKKEQQLMVKEFTFANGNSKALASQYTYRLDPSDNPRRRANVHHAGSHYHMASASGRTKGTVAGMSSRHSSQGARLQASRMQAKETARMQSGGKMTKNKSGKVTSKKMSGKSNKDGGDV